MAMFSSGATNTFLGVVLVIVAVIFLLSGLGVFENRGYYYIISESVDIILAFILLAVGLAYIYSEVGKPGKPKFEMEIKETTLGK